NAGESGARVRDGARAGGGIGLQVQVFNAGTIREIDAAFANLVRERVDGLFVSPDPFFNSRRVHLAVLAARHMVPATYAGRDYAEAGGLMSYGSNVSDAYRLAGNYTGRILKGANPADLPVMQASKFELVINASTARTLGTRNSANRARPRRRGHRMKHASSSRFLAARPWCGRVVVVVNLALIFGGGH